MRRSLSLACFWCIFYAACTGQPAGHITGFVFGFIFFLLFSFVDIDKAKKQAQLRIWRKHMERQHKKELKQKKESLFGFDETKIPEDLDGPNTPYNM